MEERRDDGLAPVVENPAQNENPAAEVAAESAPAPVAEPTAEQPAAEKPAEVVKPAAKRKASKKSGMSFGKVFLAALLAVVAGSILTVVLWLMIFSGISAAFTPAVKATPEKAILHIDLAESIVDAPSSNPLSAFNLATMQPTTSLTLYDALRALETAATDEKIEGIYLRLNGAGTMSVTIMEELRAAIARFKQSGKFVVAYNEVYSQLGYYLCSVADKVYIQPEGSFEWMGMNMSTIFFKGLIDKLGVEVDILRPTVCKYKSAVEPYFLTQMSEANRAQMQALADGIWNEITEAVSAARGISKEELNAIADNLSVTLPKEALEHKLVDGLLYADQMEELFKSEYGIEEPEFVTLNEYRSTLSPDPAKAAADKVAIVYAQGQVVDGEGPDDSIYGYTLSRKLREVAEDDDVKAVVVRVNSPGGSALASDLIWREMTLLREKKPVIVSMGEYAASGGYYISAPADAIVADRMTLTGSIGVFGMLPSVGKALKDKVGITVDGVKTNAYSNMGDGFAPLSPTARAAVMRGVDRVYERFTSLVAEGRNLTIEKVLDIAEGRVWSGIDAQKIGLVDACGGLTEAIALAVEKAALDNFQVVEHVEPAEGWMAILQNMNIKVRQHLTARSELGELYNEYKRVESMLSGNGVYTLCPYIIRYE